MKQTNKPLTLPAPAKINLFLRVLGQRTDGYHDLQTAFQFLDWCDELQVTLTNDARISVSCNWPALNTPDNLMHRAARVLQQVTGTGFGAQIHCEKSIPLGAGLGGGSSDAATTLHALNRLWQLGLSSNELATIGLPLGADIPVFVHGVAAIAEGVGERLTPTTFPEDWLGLAVPRVSVLTRSIFQHPALPRGQAKQPIADLLQTHMNDCEQLVCQLYPDIAAVFAALQDQGCNAWLTGTGCAIVAPADSAQAAQQLFKQLPPLAAWRVAKALNVSPLLTALNAL